MLGIFKVLANRKIGDKVGKVLMKMEFKAKQKKDITSMDDVKVITEDILKFISEFDEVGPQIRDIFVEDLANLCKRLPEYLHNDYEEIATQLNCLEFFSKQINYELNNPELINYHKKIRVLKHSISGKRSNKDDKLKSVKLLAEKHNSGLHNVRTRYLNIIKDKMLSDDDMENHIVFLDEKVSEECKIYDMHPDDTPSNYLVRWAMDYHVHGIKSGKDDADTRKYNYTIYFMEKYPEFGIVQKSESKELIRAFFKANPKLLMEYADLLIRDWDW